MPCVTNIQTFFKKDHTVKSFGTLLRYLQRLKTNNTDYTDSTKRQFSYIVRKYVSKREKKNSVVSL